PVPEVRRNHQLSLSADTHRADALVPTLDDAPAADRKNERLTAVVRRVELLTALQPAGIVHAHGVTWLGLPAGTLYEIDVAEAGCGLDDLLGHEVLSSLPEVYTGSCNGNFIAERRRGRCPVRDASG